MKLSLYEIKALEEYFTANDENRNPKDIIRDCRGFIICLLQTICIEEYKIKVGSNEFKNPRRCVYNRNFFYYNEKEFKSNKLKKIYKQFEIIFNTRNEENDYAEDFASINEANQCKEAINLIGQWYFSEYKKLNLNSIENLDMDIKQGVRKLFKRRFLIEEIVVEQEIYYVILLIDKSESMLYPFLDNPEKFNRNSEDYKNAGKKATNAMELAHDKALNALRSSFACKHGYMKVFQFIFNNEKIVLNEPEILSTKGNDKVVKIDRNNYTPIGGTALYTTILESLKIIYNDYLYTTLQTNGRFDKVIIGVITDGDDTDLIKDRYFLKEPTIKEIKQYMKLLRGDIRGRFLFSSVLIGLTNDQFEDNNLAKLKKELGFDESISILQENEESIKQAFKLFTTHAKNV